MQIQNKADRWIRFGVYEVNTVERIILRKGAKLRLQNKPFAVLTILLESQGELVRRDDLRRELWPTGTHVDFEHGLTVAIHKLRVALDDPAQSSRFIETVLGFGYRFIGPISTIQANVQAARRSMMLVLPFTGFAPGSEMDYLADGLTEELTARLSMAVPEQLGVIGRRTAMCYKHATRSVAAIGREVGVDYVLEGTIRGRDGTLRLTAQLIRITDQSQIWTEFLLGDGSDPIHAQITLSDQVARSLILFLFPSESPDFHGTMPRPTQSLIYELMCG